MGRPKGPKRPAVMVPDGGWQSARKTLSVRQPPSEPKRQVVLDTEHSDVQSRRLVWRFSEVDRGGDWPPSEIGGQALGGLLEKMASYESMTIGEVFCPGSEHGKKYAVDSLPPSTRKRLGEIERDDETEIARLRCGGKPRLYGFLREHVFHVVWWDAEHSVFPSKKKHT